MEVVAGMTPGLSRKGAWDDPARMWSLLSSVFRQLGGDWDTGLIDDNVAQSSARWALFEDANEDAYTGINSTTPTLLALMPVFQFIGTRGQWVGWATVRAAVTGSGRARMRLYDYIASAFVDECSWSFDFDDTVSDVLVMNAHHSLKSLSGQVRYGLVVDRESGTGSFDVGIDDGKLSILVVGQTGSPSEPDPGSEEFVYTGAAEYFTVPTNVFEVTVTMYGGAASASGSTNTGGGARGGYIKCSVPVVPNQVLEVNVGGGGITGSNAPKSVGGYNGGGAGGADPNPGGYGAGAGGGASDIRAYPYALADRLVVAGGGGGDAGVGTTGGTGGYTDGAAGTGSGATGGGGGTQSAGGAAGNTANGGTDGAFGQGGNGDQASGTRYGGGGGGGWYGGGGGGSAFGSGQAGGGGGSSYYDAGAGVVLIEETDGGGPSGNDATVLFEW